MEKSFVGNIKSTLSYYNILFVPSEVKMEARKVGKLEVGPLIPEGVDKNKTQ